LPTNVLSKKLNEILNYIESVLQSFDLLNLLKTYYFIVILEELERDNRRIDDLHFHHDVSSEDGVVPELVFLDYMSSCVSSTIGKQSLLKNRWIEDGWKEVEGKGNLTKEASDSVDLLFRTKCKEGHQILISNNHEILHAVPTPLAQTKSKVGDDFLESQIEMLTNRNMVRLQIITHERAIESIWSSSNHLVSIEIDGDRKNFVSKTKDITRYESFAEFEGDRNAFFGGRKRFKKKTKHRKKNLIL
jgi:hypothetical protein